jgi:uncharacterized Zn finger protein
MSWYTDWTPRPTIETDEGIKAKSKRGAFVKNWWATRWLASMENLIDRGRLGRGRRYARKGQVLSLTEETGLVTAEVQGSRRRPYVVTIAVEPFTDTAWERVIEALARRPIFLAQLLAGEMPQDIEEVFASVGLSLLPARAADLEMDCSCPDWASVCKHLAAVHYILAERFDEDPFLIFRLRGRSQEEILGALSQKGGTGYADETPLPQYTPAPPLLESINSFWDMGEALSHFGTHIAPPETPYPLLVRLGAPAYLEDIQRWLGPAYDAMSETAVKAVFTEEDDEAEESAR